MRKFLMCFGGAAAVAAAEDDGDKAAAAAAAEPGRRRRGSSRLASSFRRKFLSGGGSKGSGIKNKKTRGADVADYSVYAASSTSFTASSSAAESSSSSSRTSCASSVPSSSLLQALPSSPSDASPRRRWQLPSATSPAAAFVLCLLMVVLCGRVGATLLTSTAMFLLTRRWPPAMAPAARKGKAVGSDSESEEDRAARMKAVTEGLLRWKNRKE